MTTGYFIKQRTTRNKNNIIEVIYNNGYKKKLSIITNRNIFVIHIVQGFEILLKLVDHFGIFFPNEFVKIHLIHNQYFITLGSKARCSNCPKCDVSQNRCGVSLTRNTFLLITNYTKDRI